MLARSQAASGVPKSAVPPSSRFAATACSTSPVSSRPCAICARPTIPQAPCGPPRASRGGPDAPAAPLRAASGEPLGALEPILSNTPPDARDASKPWLLAPIDLQAVKAAGVTFAVSMLERVIEERARGNPDAAAAIRSEVSRLVGDDLARLKPGSAEAMALKAVLVEQGAVGATLGNDVNLRDFEGRSALLLSKAKDNNASCAI